MAIAASLGHSAAAAEIEVLAKGARFPEGPLWADDALYFVEYGGHTILRVGADDVPAKIWERPGCGPAALVRAGADFLVTCYDENTLVRVSPAGETLQVYDKDAAGAAFIGPNDFVADDAGGVFMSASGPWETAPIVGKILYRAPDGTLRTVADDLHYANGLALSPDGRTLYCSETYGYRIVAFTSARAAASPTAASSRASPRSPAAPSRWRPTASRSTPRATCTSPSTKAAWCWWPIPRASCWRPSIRPRPTSRTWPSVPTRACFTSRAWSTLRPHPGPARSIGSPTRSRPAAGLNERYVREWLGAMLTAGVVEHEPGSGTYTLPPEHAARLTRAASPANLALQAQYIPFLGTVEDEIVACFRKGGGVPYTRYGQFHQLMAEDSGQSVLPMLRDHILPLVPGLIDRLKRGIRVLDVGCGRGRAVNLLG